MKLVVAVVQDYDVDRLLRRVVADGLGATRLTSTGGFLRTGNTTVLLGVADDHVERCLRGLRETCGVRIDRPSAGLATELLEVYASGLAEATLGGAVAFVAAVERFERFECV